METQQIELQSLRRQLAQVAIAPEAELRFLVESVTGVNLFEALAGLAQIDDFQTLRRLVQRRISERIPFQYLVGEADFFGLKFTVSPDVLIPRQETELLVEKAIELLGCPQNGGLVADVGTGSGCIAVALAKNCPKLRILATDISLEAIKVARKNAERHGVEHRVFFVQTDVLNGVNAKFRLIVSNPPYIKTSEWESLPPEVRHEPKIALDGGEDGLKVIRKILRYKNLLAPNGVILLEIDPQILDGLRALAEDLGYGITTDKDLNGLVRTAVLKPLRGGE